MKVLTTTKLYLIYCDQSRIRTYNPQLIVHPRHRSQPTNGIPSTGGFPISHPVIYLVVCVVLETTRRITCSVVCLIRFLRYLNQKYT